MSVLVLMERSWREIFNFLHSWSKISPPQTGVCVCLCVVASEMTTKMVIKQPQPVLESRESDEWNSGVCDCWDDKAECE